MATYMIHCCNQRLWYVQKYLMPSMIKQGIAEKDIILWLDSDEVGCLESCMRSFASVNDGGGVWHLQDDVILCPDFKDRTEQHDTGIVCGYCSVYDGNKQPGNTTINYAWLSFPCIRIPNKFSKECAGWFFKNATNDAQYRLWIQSKRNDDIIFAYFMQNYYMSEPVLNLAPNLVNHIDYLIGGSIVNKIRDKEKDISSKYWNWPDEIKMLKLALKNDV